MKKNVTLNELAALIAREVGYNSILALDPTKPDGTPRKFLDTTKLTRLGWKPTINLEEGI